MTSLMIAFFFSVLASPQESRGGGVEYFMLRNAQTGYDDHYLVDVAGNIDETGITVGPIYSSATVLWKDAKDERRAHWYTVDAGSGNVYIVNRYSGRKLKRSTTYDGISMYYLDLVAGSDTSNAAKWTLNSNVDDAVRLENVAYPGWYPHQKNGDSVLCSQTISDRTLWHMEMLPPGASLPMVRYDENEYHSANITMVTSGVRGFEASEGKCFKLAAINWIAKQDADGCVLRFSLDDSPNGGGTTANVTIRAKDAATGALLRFKTITLDSKYAWLYGWKGEASDDPANTETPPRRAFDHYRFTFEVNEGEIIRLDTSANVWIDYLETEVIPPAITPPAGAIVVNPGQDIQMVLNNAATTNGSTVFLAAGVHEVPGMIQMKKEIKLWGAGMWHTTLKFTDPLGMIGGIQASLNDPAKKVDVRNLYLQGLRTYRYDAGGYQALNGSWYAWGSNSVVDSIWWDHMCNTWLKQSGNLRIQNCRVFDNYAGGIISAGESNNHLVYDNNLVRHCDDDGLTGPANTAGALLNSDWQCRYNTVEFNSRAAGIGLFNLNGAMVYKNLLKDNWNEGPLRATTSFDFGSGWSPTVYSEVFDNLFVDNRGEAEIHFSVKYEPLDGLLIHDNVFVGSNPTLGLIYARHYTYTGYDPDDLCITNVFTYNNVFEYVKSDVPVVSIRGTLLYGTLDVDDSLVTYTGDRPDLESNGSDMVVNMSGIECYEVQCVALESMANNKYVTVDASLGDQLIASQTSYGANELFDLLYLDPTDPDLVALYSRGNGYYVCAENRGADPLNASRTSVGAWEKFDISINGDGTVSFKAKVNSKFVCAGSAGADPLKASSTSVGSWEKFDLIDLTP